MSEYGSNLTSTEEKWADKLTKERVFGFLFVLIALLILIEFHAINKPAEERSTQDSDVWYEMLIGDIKDFGHDIANGNFVVVSKIVNGEPVEPFHAEKSSNVNSKKNPTSYVVLAVVTSLLTGVILYSYGKKHWITSNTDLTSSDNDVEELDFSFDNDKADSLGKDIIAFQSVVEEDGTVSEYEEL